MRRAAFEKGASILAPTLRRGSNYRRSGVPWAFGLVERPGLHSHAERGNEKKSLIRNKLDGILHVS
jgi:hypothetical protein